MIATARERLGAQGVGAELHVGDACHLPFADGSFAGCLAMRLLQHLTRPAAALREMVRVVRAGGTLLVSDPDWGTLVIDSDDRALGDTIARLPSTRIRSAAIGRQLRAMFTDLGLRDVTVLPRPVVVTSFAEADTLFCLRPAIDDAVHDGVLAASDRQTWIGEMAERDRAGRFFACMSSFIVHGRRA